MLVVLLVALRLRQASRLFTVPTQSLQSSARDQRSQNKTGKRNGFVISAAVNREGEAGGRDLMLRKARLCNFCLAIIIVTQGPAPSNGRGARSICADSSTTIWPFIVVVVVVVEQEVPAVGARRFDNHFHCCFLSLVLPIVLAQIDPCSWPRMEGPKQLEVAQQQQ